MGVMANSLPYFNFYPADFLLDERVEMMTPAQVGCYILLLSRSWISSEPGYIPTDPERQARLLRLSRQDWDAIKGPVLECFKSDGDRLYQARLLEEYNKAREAHEARVRGGLSKSGRSEKHHKTKARNAQRKLSTCSAQAEHQLSTSSADASLQAKQVVKHVVTEQIRTEQIRTENTPQPPEGAAAGAAVRARDPVWDAICDVFGLRPVTKTERTRVGKLRRDYAAKGATEQEMRRRLKHHQQTWPNVRPVTPESLIKHWDQLEHEPQQPDDGMVSRIRPAEPLKYRLFRSDEPSAPDDAARVPDTEPGASDQDGERCPF